MALGVGGACWKGVSLDTPKGSQRQLRPYVQDGEFGRPGKAIFKNLRFL